MQTAAVAGDLAVPVAAKTTALSIARAVNQTGAGLLIDGDVVKTAVVGWEAGVGRGANFKVAAVGKSLGVGLRAGGCLEVVPGVEVGGRALEEWVNEQFCAGHGDHEGHVGGWRVAVVVVVGVVGVGQVGSPALLSGGAASRNVGGGKRAVFPADAA